jgi:hypothetical protein
VAIKICLHSLTSCKGPVSELRPSTKHGACGVAN